MFFDVVDKQLVLNLEYILFYKEFETLYTKYIDEGEEKVKAIFKYIYERCDNRSYSNRSGYDEGKAHEYAVRISKLNNNFVVIRPVKAAMDFYRKHNDTVNAKLLKDLKATLQLSVDINKQIQKALATKINDDKIEPDAIITVINLQNKLFETINQLPDKFTKIKELEHTIYEELRESPGKARGKTDILPSYEGDPDIEGEL